MSVCVCVKAARRELEHQRQLEWERQRRDQLMSETQREQSQVDRLRLEIGQHRQELGIVVCTIPSEICAQSELLPFENADFDRFPLITSQSKR